MSNKKHRMPDEGELHGRWAVGLPGKPPSRAAARLAATLPAGALLPGLWHLSDHAADRLAGTVPVISDATHQPTGARFRLASLPDGPILAVEALCKAAQALIVAAWSDPTTWANRQSWRIAPAASGPSPPATTTPQARGSPWPDRPA